MQDTDTLKQIQTLAFRDCEDSPGLYMSSWHEWGSITCPFLTATDSAANKQQALRFQTLAPPLYDRNTWVLREHPPLYTKIYSCAMIRCRLRLCLCTQSCHHQWWYPQLQEEEPEEEVEVEEKRRIDLTWCDSIFSQLISFHSAQTTNQFINEVIHSLSGLHQQDDPSGLLQLGHHVLKGLCSDHLGALCLILQEVVHLGHGSVVGTDLLER